MVLGCVIFAFVIAAIAAGLAVISGRRIGYTFFPAIALVGTVGSVFCASGLLQGALWSSVALAVAGPAVSFVYVKRRGRDTVKLLINSDIAVYAVMTLFFILINSGRVYYLNDEFSHWGLAVKNMFETGEFYASSVSNDLFKHYPPFATVVCYICSAFCGSFSEAATFVGMDLMLWACLMPIVAIFTEKLKEKGTSLQYRFLPGMAAALIVSVLCFKLSAFTIISVDTLLGLMTAYAVVSYFASGSLLFLHFVVTALTLTKEAGITLAIFAIVLCGVDALIKKVQFGKLIKGVAFSLIAVACAKGFWSAAELLGEIGGSKSIDTGLFGRLGVIFREGLNDVQKETLFSFGKAFLEPRMSVGIPLIAVIIILIVLSVALIIYIKKTRERVYFLRSVIAFAEVCAGFVLYAFGVLASYWTSFSAYEAVRVASFERYFGTYVTFWLLVLVTGFVSTALTDFLKSLRNIKAITALTAVSAVAAAGVVVFFFVFYPYSAETSVSFREEYKSSEIVGQYYREGKLSSEDRILFIPDENYENKDMLIANYNASPINVVYEDDWEEALALGEYDYVFKDEKLCTYELTQSGEFVFSEVNW